MNEISVLLFQESLANPLLKKDFFFFAREKLFDLVVTPIKSLALLLEAIVLLCSSGFAVFFSLKATLLEIDSVEM